MNKKSKKTYHNLSSRNFFSYTVTPRDLEQSRCKVIDIMSQSMQLSVRRIREAKRCKKVLLNGQSVSVNAVVQSGDEVRIQCLEEKNIFPPEPLAVEIIYENEDLLVVNKPPFLVVHPTKGHPSGTLGNALAYYQQKQGQDYKIRFINRLDRDTSGLMMIAKNAYAQHEISKQMRGRQVVKKYIAVVEGAVSEEKGVISAPMGRQAEDDIRRSVFEGGADAITHFEVLQRLNHYTVLSLVLITGRTHQIRVHMQHIGHPIVGDTLYGQESKLIKRQALHCVYLAFELPFAKTPIKCHAPLPQDIQQLIDLSSYML